MSRKSKTKPKTETEPELDTADAKPLDGDAKPDESTEPTPEETGLIPDNPEPAGPSPTEEDAAAPVKTEAEPESTMEDEVDDEPHGAKYEPPVFEAPSIEEVMDLGFDADAAERIVVAFKNAESVLKFETFHRDIGAHRATNPHYLVSGSTKRGYWKIGRQFTNEVTLFAEELTAEEMVELDNANPKHLIVKRIGFDGAEV